MKIISQFLIIGGAYFIVSQSVLFVLIRIFSYSELRSQYAQGGIEAIFLVSESNYMTGLLLAMVFAIAALLKGIELKNREGSIKRGWKVALSLLALEVFISSVYFTFLNLLRLINPSYF